MAIGVHVRFKVAFTSSFLPLFLFSCKHVLLLPVATGLSPSAQDYHSLARHPSNVAAMSAPLPEPDEQMAYTTELGPAPHQQRLISAPSPEHRKQVANTTELRPASEQQQTTPAQKAQHDRDVAEYKDILIAHQKGRHLKVNSQEVYIVAYGFGTPDHDYMTEFFSKTPLPPRPPEQHILLRRNTPRPPAAPVKSWSLPQLPEHYIQSMDVRNNAMVDRVVHPFLKITIAGPVPPFVAVPDEHLLWDSLASGDAGDRVGMRKLVKYKMLSLEDTLPRVLPEVAGVYKWWPMSEVREGKLQGLEETSREWAMRLDNPVYWLEQYPKAIEEARRQLGREGA